MKTQINKKRLTILHKGYASKTDIRRFIPCGSERANDIYEEIRTKVSNEGFENLGKYILAERLCPYVGLTKKQIIEFAKEE